MEKAGGIPVQGDSSYLTYVHPYNTGSTGIVSHGVFVSAPVEEGARTGRRYAYGIGTRWYGDGSMYVGAFCDDLKTHIQEQKEFESVAKAWEYVGARLHEHWDGLFGKEVIDEAIRKSPLVNGIRAENRLFPNKERIQKQLEKMGESFHGTSLGSRAGDIHKQYYVASTMYGMYEGFGIPHHDTYTDMKIAFMSRVEREQFEKEQSPEILMRDIRGPYSCEQDAVEVAVDILQYHKAKIGKDLYDCVTPESKKKILDKEKLEKSELFYVNGDLKPEVECLLISNKTGWQVCDSAEHKKEALAMTFEERQKCGLSVRWGNSKAEVLGKGIETFERIYNEGKEGYAEKSVFGIRNELAKELGKEYPCDTLDCVEHEKCKYIVFRSDHRDIKEGYGNDIEKERRTGPRKTLVLDGVDLRVDITQAFGVEPGMSADKVKFNKDGEVRYGLCMVEKQGSLCEFWQFTRDFTQREAVSFVRQFREHERKQEAVKAKKKTGTRGVQKQRRAV